MYVYTKKTTFTNLTQKGILYLKSKDIINCYIDKYKYTYMYIQYYTYTYTHIFN